MRKFSLWLWQPGLACKSLLTPPALAASRTHHQTIRRAAESPPNWHGSGGTTTRHEYGPTMARVDPRVNTGDGWSHCVGQGRWRPLPSRRPIQPPMPQLRKGLLARRKGSGRAIALIRGAQVLFAGSTSRKNAGTSSTNGSVAPSGCHRTWPVIMAARSSCGCQRSMICTSGSTTQYSKTLFRW